MSFLLDSLRAHAARDPLAPALEDAAGCMLNREALVAAVENQITTLRALLDDFTRPVALLADRSVAQYVTDLALMECGVPVLSLPPFFTESQRAHALAHSGAQLLVRDRDGALVHEPLATGAPIPLPRGTARISYTSGSTGTAKGICLSAAHLRAVASGVVVAAGAGPADRHLAVLPPGVLLEEVAGCHAALLAGATYIAAPQASVGLAAPFQPDFAQLVAAIERGRATSLILVPEYLAGLAAFMAQTGTRLPLLRLVAVGGARVAPAVMELALGVGLPVRQGYGLTECGSVVSLHDGGLEAVGSVGHTLGVHRLRLAQDGEILVDGPLYLGTVGSPRAHNADAGGYRTGDIGRLDAAGNLWIEGRKSNLIITSFGRNVSPEWIESLLVGQGAIAQALVHGDGAASLSALIVPRGACSDAQIAAAVATVNADLPEYARIGHWRRALPFTAANGQLTGNGRLRRTRILEHYPMEESADAVL